MRIARGLWNGLIIAIGSCIGGMLYDGQLTWELSGFYFAPLTALLYEFYPSPNHEGN